MSCATRWSHARGIAVVPSRWQATQRGDAPPRCRPPRRRSPSIRPGGGSPRGRLPVTRWLRRSSSHGAGRNGYSHGVSILAPAARAASSAGGQILRSATAALAVRPAAKPLHPRGTLATATLRRFSDGHSTGAAWLDQRGDDDVLVRQSRAVGLPAPLPDIFGLAIRVPTGGGSHGDLLFATTGLGRLTRFALTAARSPYRRPMTTLLPYRTPVGAVLLSAVFHSETDVQLAWAHLAGPWHPFAELILDQELDDETTDLPVSFDPVRNVLPGLETFDWVRRLREPAYVTARQSRGS